MERTDTVIIGASAAGLATAACIPGEHVLLEATDHVGHAWRNHYERLSLHTPKSASGLPGLPMPSAWPRYPGREKVVEYLELYATHHQLAPRFHQTVQRVHHDGESWVTETQDATWRSSRVVVATGYTRKPVVPALPGDFTGRVLHSSEYRTGRDFAGQHVLVIGFGNSACEIALDLHEQGASAALAVRSAVNVVPRDLFGIPTLNVGLVMRHLPYWLSDALAAPLIWAAVGNITDYGLKKLPYGPNEQILRHQRIPLLDVGTMEFIKSGDIQVRPAIETLDGADVVFVDERREPYDAIVLATGYEPALADFLEADVPRVPPSGEEVLPGLFFCGFYVSPSGMLREIGIEAQRIAALMRA